MKVRKYLLLAGTIIGVTSVVFTMNVKARGKDKDTFICEEYQNYIYDIASDYGVCPELIMAMIENESSGRADAVNGSCIGLMQIDKNVHKERIEDLGADLYHPYDNILVGVDIFMDYAMKYDGVAEALGHYHGERNVEERTANDEMSYYVTKILNRSMELERVHGK